MKTESDNSYEKEKKQSAPPWRQPEEVALWWKEGAWALYVVEKYKLDIVRFTSTHNLDSGTSVVERGWTLF